MNRFLTLIAIMFAMCLASCASEPTVRVDAIDPLLQNVTTRHDAYVATDETLSLAERQIYLESSELLRRILVEARGDVVDAEAQPMPPLEDTPIDVTPIKHPAPGS